MQSFGLHPLLRFTVNAGAQFGGDQGGFRRDRQWNDGIIRPPDLFRRKGDGASADQQVFAGNGVQTDRVFRKKNAPGAPVRLPVDQVIPSWRMAWLLMTRSESFRA